RNLVVRVELLAHGRIDAIAGNDDVSADAGTPLSGARLLEVNDRASFILLDACAFTVGDHCIRAKPLLHCLVQDDVQPAAVDSDFRKGISGRLSAIFAINQSPETIEERAIAVFNSRLEQRVAKSKRAELAHGMRKQRDANPELFDLGGAFKHAAGDAAFFQIESER